MLVQLNTAVYRKSYQTHEATHLFVELLLQALGFRGFFFSRHWGSEFASLGSLATLPVPRFKGAATAIFLAAVSAPHLEGAAAANFLATLPVPHFKGPATANCLAALSVPRFKGAVTGSRQSAATEQAQQPAHWHSSRHSHTPPCPSCNSPIHSSTAAQPLAQQPPQPQADHRKRSQGVLLGAARATPKCRQCNVKSKANQ